MYEVNIKNFQKNKIRFNKLNYYQINKKMKKVIDICIIIQEKIWIKFNLYLIKKMIKNKATIIKNRYYIQANIRTNIIILWIVPT